MYVIKKIIKIIKKFKLKNIKRLIGKIDNKKRVIFEDISENLLISK